MAFDPVLNFAKPTVSTGYDAAATSIVLSAGHGAKLPAPGVSGAFNMTWWNATDYSDPSDDPNVEIVRVTARSTDTLTVTRAQESTSASTKNTSGKTYRMVLSFSASMYNAICSGGESGTGALARVVSPSFTTPTLGTPASGTLTNCSGLPVSGITASTSTALGVGSVELGHASDTTIARVSAGVISVEGVTVPTISSASTLTNKTIDAASNTISNLTLAMFAANVIDTDGTLAANSDARVSSQKAIKTYVDNAVTGLLDFKGSTDASGNPNYPAASKGDAYYISVAGKVGGASGKSVEVGDLYVASADNAGGAEASVGTSWFVMEHNLVGAVISGGALGTPSSGTLTNCTGLPIGSGVSGLGTGVATFLGTPSGANLLSALTTKTGTGIPVFDTSPTFTTQLTTPIAYGSAASGGTLTLGSTSHATKGNILFGASAYDEVNNRLGIGVTTPSFDISFPGTAAKTIGMERRAGNAGNSLEIQAAGAGVGTTDKVGGDLDLSAGICTGNKSSKVVFRTSAPGASGSADNTLWNTGIIQTTSTQAILTLGTAGTSPGPYLGTIRLNGTTSGSADIVPTAAAGDVTITLPASTGTVALTANKLSVFAATTSAELAGVVTDETGTGGLVFGTTPTFVNSIVVAKQAAGAVGPVIDLHNDPTTLNDACSIRFYDTSLRSELRFVVAASPYGGDLVFISGDPTGALTEKFRVSCSGGVTVGSPTGGDKGAGTINAQAVYDDNVLLTCYVAEAEKTGRIDYDKWDRLATGKARHDMARRFDTSILDLNTYHNRYMTAGVLPGFPTPEEWIANPLPVGQLVNLLWEQVEVLAVHIGRLNSLVTNGKKNAV